MMDGFGTYPLNLACSLKGTELLERIHWLGAPGDRPGEGPLVARWELGD